MKHERIIVIGIIFYSIINVVQAVFQPLLLDEAYYLYYSKQLDLGYFDHPPMVAWLIWLGQTFCVNEIGVRLGGLILSFLSCYFLFKLIKKKGNLELELNKVLLLFSFPFMHALHIAIPDSGLVFFTVLFYFLFEKYIEKDSLINGVLLGVVSAGMMYAKYHGALTIFLAIVSYPKILERKSIWVSFGIFLVLLFPHLFWLYNNEFITIEFQLFGRGGGSFSSKNILDYLLSFGLIVFGILIVFLFNPNVFREVFLEENEKSNPVFKRSLSMAIIGFFLFFLIFSMRGPIEGNWLFSASVPALILFGRSRIIESYSARGLMIFSVSIFLAVRVMLITGMVPKVGYLYHFTGYSQWAKDIQEKADGRKVFFGNSYQMASMYSFQTGEESFSLNTLGSRSNQYDFHCFEQLPKETEVLVVSEWMDWEGTADTMNHEKGIYKLHKYYGLTFLNRTGLLLEDISRDAGLCEVNFSITNPCDVSLLELNDAGELKVILELEKSEENPSVIELVSSEYSLSKDQLSLSVYLEEQVLSIRVGFRVNNGPISNNSDKIEIPH